ncbi:MAG: AAA family ATPase [Pseudomonadota bacterium]
MSIIERAIDRLDGNSPKRGEPAQDPAKPSEQELLRDELKATADWDGGEENFPSEMAATAPESPPVASTPQADSARGAAQPVADDGSSKVAQIDFPSLAQRGMLTPYATADQQSEEYQYIKRRLLGNIVLEGDANQRPQNLIMVTSSIPGEGKTFNTMNLAISLAMEMDHTVLVVDTDVAKRDLTRHFGLTGSTGLYDYLVNDDLDVGECLYRSNRSNLNVLPAGTHEKINTELVASHRMRRLMAELAERYSDRVILFDTPPLLANTTATALAPMVGQVVLVVAADETEQGTLSSAVEHLHGVAISGVILNKSKASFRKSYQYSGYYGKVR